MTKKVQLKDVADVLFAYEAVGEIEEKEKVTEDDLVYVKLLHRKVEKERLYFITPYTTQLFSAPMMLSFENKMTQKKLYEIVNEKVAFMTFNEEKSGEGKEKDSDENQEAVPVYPFVIRQVNDSGDRCPVSEWYHFSIGRTVDPNSDEIITFDYGSTIALDWIIPVYKLKYYRDDRKWYDEHPSVKENWDLLNSPIALDQCKFCYEILRSNGC